MSLLLLFHGAAATYTLAPAQGAYVLTGKAATLRPQFVEAGQGSFVLSGQAASLAHFPILVSAVCGQYALTGNPTYYGRQSSANRQLIQNPPNYGGLNPLFEPGVL